MKKLLARIKQWNNSNAGLTLVEIIVTMLILVIIALPILGGFITAARANAMAKDLAYARDAAENVVEVANSGGDLEAKFDAAHWTYTLSGNPETDDTFSYTITDVRSGTGVYTAVLECNKTTYQDANNYVLPDMSALDAEETVVIFPESNFYKFKDDGTLEDATNLHRFDTTAIGDFYRDYHDGVVDIYNSIVYASYLDEVKRVENVNKEIMAQPTPSPTLAPPEMPEYPKVIRKMDSVLTVEDGGVTNEYQPVKTYLHRIVDIKVTYSPSTDAEDEDRVQAAVSTEYKYEMRDKDVLTDNLTLMVEASFAQYRSSDFDYISFSELDTAISNLVTRLKEPKAYAVAAETTVDTLDNIYLIIFPFDAMKTLATDPIQISPCNTLELTVELNGVEETYLADKQVNVFVTMQEDTIPYAAGDYMNVKATSNHAKALFDLYSQISLYSSEFTFEGENQKLYKDRENSNGNVLLDVTVKLYSPDNVTAGQELTEVKTTISSKK